jgi:hypothetical protein
MKFKLELIDDRYILSYERFVPCHHIEADSHGEALAMAYLLAGDHITYMEDVDASNKREVSYSEEFEL